MVECPILLSNHAFEDLFIRVLGWDQLRTSFSVQCKNEWFELESIAEKRGFVVLSVPAHRTILADRRLLHGIQRQVGKHYHEHVLIFHCDSPRKQVWAWSFYGSDGESIKHREHPFFSDNPPPLLLDRLNRLAFRLEEEDRISLVDVVSRVRSALLPQAEFNLFAKWPNYARRTEKLSIAYREGNASALTEMVAMHLPLARKWSRVGRRRLGMEKEEAEQVAVLGLIRAAQRFEPERGYQFSTMAVPWIRQACERYGIEKVPFIRVPSHLYWPCWKADKELAALACRGGRSYTLSRVGDVLGQFGVLPQDWQQVCLSRELKLAVNLPTSVWRASQAIEAATPVDLLVREETRQAVLHELDQMPKRDATVLRKRFGLDGPEETLEQIAQPMRLTRERIRQIEDRAKARLKKRCIERGLIPDGGLPEQAAPIPDVQPTDVATTATTGPVPDPEPQDDEDLTETATPMDLDDMIVEDTGLFEKANAQRELNFEEPEHGTD